MDHLKLIADPTRREILRLVWTDPKPAGEIAENFPMTFGAVSQHLALLRDAGFVTVTREGNRRIYNANQSGLGPLAPLIEALWSDRLEALAKAAEERD